MYEYRSVRHHAAAIISGRKVQMLEEEGMTVVEIGMLRRLADVFEKAPWQHRVDSKEYIEWYQYIDTVWSELEKILDMVERAAMKR